MKTKERQKETGLKAKNIRVRKVGVRIMALALAFGMCFSITACNFGGEDSNPNNPNTVVPTTDEEIFSYVIEAMETSKTYRGDITGSMSSTKKSKEVNESVTLTISFDESEKVIYGEGGGTENGLNFKYIVKTFFQNGKLYEYEKVTTISPITGNVLEESKDYCERRYDAFDEVTSFEALDFDSVLEAEEFANWKLAENVGELESAYQEVYDYIMVDTAAEGATVEVEATAWVMVINGIYTISVEINSLVEWIWVDGYYESEYLHTLERYDRFWVSAKDGKLVEYGIESRSDANGYIEEEERKATIAYAFEKEKYDAIIVRLPKDKSEISVVGMPYAKLYVNGILVEEDILMGKAEGQLGTALENFQDDIQVYLNNIGLTSDRLSSIKAYKNAEHTKGIDLTAISRKDYYDLREIHVEIALKDEWALVSTKRIERSEPAQKAYKIVGGQEEWIYEESCNTIRAGNVIHFDVGEKIEVYVNGVKQDKTVTSLTLESNKTYQIEYVKVDDWIYVDEDINDSTPTPTPTPEPVCEP